MLRWYVQALGSSEGIGEEEIVAGGDDDTVSRMLLWFVQAGNYNWKY